MLTRNEFLRLGRADRKEICLVAFIIERIENLMKYFVLIVFLILILIGCDKKPDKVVLDAFEDIHSSSVYYVVQGEESKIINSDSENSFVELCYEIRRNLGALFKKECSVVRLIVKNENWEIIQSLQRIDNVFCWNEDINNPFKVIENYKNLNFKDIELCQ